MNYLLSTTMMGREVARILAEQLDLNTYPEVVAEWIGGRLSIRWSGVTASAAVDLNDARLSLDQFSDRYLLRLVSELCGRPLLNEGSIVVNPVHDEAMAA